MIGVLLMISNYFHDLAVALLASSIAVVVILGRYLQHHESRVELLGHIITRLSRITYGALAFVLIGGIIRAYFFMDYEWNPAVGKGQVAALIVKHIILVSLTIAGIVVHVRYVRKYGRKA